MKKSKVTSSEAGVIGVRTRARTLAMEAAETAKKKRKRKQKLKLVSSSSRRRSLPEASKKSSRRVKETSTTTTTTTTTSQYSSNGSRELVNESLMTRSVSDPESESSSCFDCRKRTMSSNLQQVSDDRESMERVSLSLSPTHQCRSTVEKIPPSETEIDEFFSIAEKAQQRRFARMYNYDFVKDVPLEGRYEWTPVKP